MQTIETFHDNFQSCFCLFGSAYIIILVSSILWYQLLQFKTVVCINSAVRDDFIHRNDNSPD